MLRLARTAVRTGTRRLGTSSKPRARSSINSPGFGGTLLLGSACMSVGYMLSWYMNDKKANASSCGSSTLKLGEATAPQYGGAAEFESCFKELSQVLQPDQLSVDKNDLQQHTNCDYSTHTSATKLPQLVVYPNTTQEVSQVMQAANKYRIPVIPYSGGTSIEGGLISTKAHTIVVSLQNMDQIIQLNHDDMDIKVQPGVNWQYLNEYLKPYELMIGPDPGPGAMIGGMVGTSCSGTNAARYGTMKENAISLTVVLPDGTIIKTRNRPRKTSAGYNLTNLFVGSEGTLGIVTEITLRCHNKPQETVGVLSFPTIKNATDFVTRVVQKGLVLNAVELLDTNMMKVINEMGTTSRKWNEMPTLFIKISKNNASLKEEITKLSSENKVIKIEYAKDASECNNLWEARKIGFWSTIEYCKKTISPDVKVWTTDVAVPISKLSKVIEETLTDIKQNNIFTTVLGHVGDGNFHAILIYEPNQRELVSNLSERCVLRAIENDGTCTGEHGIGIGKRKYLIEELGQDTVDLMRQIKTSIDPNKIMNPDKIFKIDPNDNY